MITPNAGRSRRPNLVLLWLIVSGIWTIATLLRMDRVWVPGRGWPAVLDDGVTWASLLAPPLTFAAVLLFVSVVAGVRDGQ